MGNVTWSDPYIKNVTAALYNTKNSFTCDTAKLTSNKTFILSKYVGGEFNKEDFIVNITYTYNGQGKSLVNKIPDNCTNKDSYTTTVGYNYNEKKDYTCVLKNITLTNE
uniref:Ig-like domain-containing protein n=1 Tax=Strongyloides papillosus TaxID=174720 RepID=A0A0N5BHF9_STREA